ncbi:MAG: DNA-binding transcriptional repressor AcrR [Alphaproteobacteria bacterium ADurb.BinA280]|jgi:AcrR family transcriptional regulator|nr:MAG: DNA-binding transcriptional repressor AcrR [Alphaproteobacteria bacterium ADurb.BinA280]
MDFWCSVLHRNALIAKDLSSSCAITLVCNTPAHGYTAKMNDVAAKMEKPSRLSATDWAQGALALIAEQGVNAVAVEPLARRLGVTKGSFYWHFPSREALLRAALEFWEQNELEDVFARLEGITDPRERLEELFRRVGSEAPTHAIYSELLKALDHPVVQPVMQRVTQRRTDWLSLAYRQVGLPRSEALQRARLTHAAYVGFLQMSLQLRQPRMTHEEFDDYLAHVMTTLIPRQ